MPVEIGEESTESLAEYATIPMAFWARSMLRVDWIDSGLRGIRLTEQPVEPPCVKNYDSVGNTPLNWNQRWDISNWGIFLARDNGELIGGAAIAWRTPGLHMLEQRDDLAVLWDLRVKPKWQRQGVGQQLMSRAVSWADIATATASRLRRRTTTCRHAVSTQRAATGLVGCTPAHTPIFPMRSCFCGTWILRNRRQSLMNRGEIKASGTVSLCAKIKVFPEKIPIILKAMGRSLDLRYPLIRQNSMFLQSGIGQIKTLPDTSLTPFSPVALSCSVVTVKQV
jgi:GNAT superfamily N-acetyltransferase